VFESVLMLRILERDVFVSVSLFVQLSLNQILI
jgi:hypothetical protein